MARMVIESLKGMLTGRFGLNDIAGPVGTAQVIAQAAGQGLKEGFGTAVSNIVMMIIMITVNLGIVNLLPLPALDGGRLLFLIWEGVSRKPVPAKYEGYIHAAGFVLLLGLMVLIAFNDVLRLKMCIRDSSWRVEIWPFLPFCERVNSFSSAAVSS